MEAKKLLFEKYKIDNLKPQFEFKQNVDIKTKNKFLAINNDAALFYEYQLLLDNSKFAKDYLKKRNISDQQIKDFILGYAPKDNSLYDFLKQKGYQDQEMLDAGIIYEKDNNRFNDFFKDRIIIPIKDNKGRIVGFSSRSLGNNNQVRYLNIAETPIFEKSKILYNLDKTKNEESIFLVEGYMDVIALNKINIPAVALMNASLSDYQEKLLIANFKKIKILLDNDTAGKTAALKISKQLSKYPGLDLTVIDNNSKYKDADELVNNIDHNILHRTLNLNKEQKYENNFSLNNKEEI